MYNNTILTVHISLCFNADEQDACATHISLTESRVQDEGYPVSTIRMLVPSFVHIPPNVFALEDPARIMELV